MCGVCGKKVLYVVWVHCMLGLCLHGLCVRYVCYICSMSVACVAYGHVVDVWCVCAVCVCAVCAVLLGVWVQIVFGTHMWCVHHNNSVCMCSAYV